MPLNGACSLETRLTPAVHFAAIGDYGNAGQPEADVAALVGGWNPDFVITLGDNNYDVGAAATIDANIGQYYHQFIGNYTGGYGAGSAVNRFFPALGNHDWYSATGSPPLPTPYLNYFTLPGNERYYTFTQGPVQFFALDSALGDAANPTEPDGIASNSVQAQWLQTQLAASTAPWKLVYFHHPPYSSAAHGNTPVMQWPFQAWGASAVLAGHDHSYERIHVGGLPYFVNGLGGRSLYGFNAPVPGSQVRYNADYGAMLVDAADAQLQFKFYTRAGALIDSYTLVKPPPTVLSVLTNGATTGQRSRVTNMVVTFSEPVTIADPAAAFQLVRTAGGPAGTIGLTAAQAGASVTLTFTNGGSLGLDPGGSLPDGRFQLTIQATGVVGPGGHLDGNGNGTYNAADPNNDNHVTTTHRLFGDIDGDGDTDLADFVVFKQALGSSNFNPPYNAAFDFDGDGDVDLGDFNQFKARIGVIL